MNRLLTPLILIIVAVGVFFMFTNPLLTRIDGLKAEIASYDEALVNANKLAEMRDVLSKKKNDIRPEDLDSIEKMVPDTIDNVRLILDLQKIGQDKGLDLRNIRITSKGSRSAKDAIGPESTKYDSVAMGFSVTASYDRFRTLMTAIERSLRLMDVTTISFTAGDKDEYDYNVEIRTYWLK